MKRNLGCTTIAPSLLPPPHSARAPLIGATETDLGAALGAVCSVQLMGKRGDWKRSSLLGPFSQMCCSSKEDQRPRNNLFVLNLCLCQFGSLSPQGHIHVTYSFVSQILSLFPLRIVLMDDAMDCLMSFSDFLFAFQIQFYYSGENVPGPMCLLSGTMSLFLTLLSFPYVPGTHISLPHFFRGTTH